MNRETHAVYVISVAAELAGVHPQTLRIYERRGLLQPARTQGGNRRYSNADIRRLQRIAELAEAGVSLEGIRQLLELEAEVTQLRERVLELEAELRRASTERRYEIVPLRQSVTVFGRRPSIFGGDDK
ncbi:MAG: heat shock protein transcriptional repressor HspR [Ilumatobacteraceae bacterium]|jgi:MerR family transcriptional regulator/heat shock protein HspR